MWSANVSEPGTYDEHGAYDIISFTILYFILL
jgi:hypothetical protein